MAKTNGNTLRGSRATLAAWCDNEPMKAARVARLMALHGCSLARAVKAVAESSSKEVA